MKRENLLNEYDPTQGKRGYKVYYSITDRAEKSYKLKILGSNEKIKRLKNLYRLLIFFLVFEKRNPMAKRQLYSFLRRMGMTKDSLEIVKNSHTSLFANSGLIKDITHFRPLKDVQIIRWDQSTLDKDPNGAFYNIVIPGFSVKEFASYLNKLRKGKEPHPFGSYLGITDVPFVLDVRYSESEIVDAIKSFTEDHLIKSIDDVFPGEVRYNLADESLINFIKDVWLLHDIDLRLLFERLVYYGKPKENDINYLKSMYGKRIADRILANANHTRKMNKSHKNQDDEKKAKKFIQIFDNYRSKLMEDIIRRHENVIRKYEITSQLIEGICLSPFVSSQN
jgi:hypothetical protein